MDESSVDERWPLLSGRDSPASGACSAGDVDVRVIPVQHDCPASPSGPVEAELAGIGAFEDSDSDCDPDNPRNWPAHFKWSVVLLLTFMSFTVYVVPS